METSPILPGEKYTEQSEKQKELARLFKRNDFIDHLALLREHTAKTELVSAFSIYKNGDYKVGDIVSCLPEEVPTITIEDDNVVYRQKTIHCQDHLDCTQYSVDPDHKAELFMVIHSHPKNNSHCLKQESHDLLAPSVEDLEYWNQSINYKDDIIEGILVNEEDCQGLLLFTKNPKQPVQPIWNVFGSHSETIGHDSVKDIMSACGIFVAEIKLNCNLTHYHRQTNQAAAVLSGVLRK